MKISSCLFTASKRLEKSTLYCIIIGKVFWKAQGHFMRSRRRNLQTQIDFLVYNGADDCETNQYLHINQNIETV